MQILQQTRKILGDDKGELKDPLVHIDKEDILDPTFNIAAGTRWIFQKKLLAGNRLKRIATWDEAWLNDDALGRRSLDEMVCDLEIHIHGSKGLQVYAGRRAHPLSYCYHFMREWERLTKREDIVCLNGDGGNYHQDPVLGKHKSWTWNKFKTKKGCYSELVACNVKGCAKGKCPK